MTKKVKHTSKKRFIFTVVAWALILAASIFLSVIYSDSQEEFFSASDIGVLAQIITTIVSFVVSTIGIAISLQKDDSFGIQTKDFYSLRTELRFSVFGIILLAIALCALSAIFLLLNFLIATVAICVIAIWFCLYVACCELPLMLKQENAMVRIIGNNLMLHYKNNSALPKKLSDVLLYMITDEYNLKTTYELLKNKDAEYNKFLLIKLLDIQQDYAFELKYIYDKQQQHKAADSLLKNACDIAYSHFDIVAILGEDALNQRHFITRVLFRVMEVESIQKTAVREIAHWPLLLGYSNLDETRKKFLLSITLSLTSISVKQENFSIIKEMRREFANLSHLLREKNETSLTFALISLHLYYLSNDEPLAPQTLKNGIKTFVSEEGVLDGVQVLSWQNLFDKFLETFPISLGEFISGFNLNAHNWELVLEGRTFYFDTLNDQYLIKWYLSCLFYCSNNWHINIEEKLLPLTQATEYFLKQVSTDCQAEDGSFVIPDSMKEIIAFFVPSAPKHSFFQDEQNHRPTFLPFINQLHERLAEEKTEKAKAINCEDIACKYREAITKRITKEWGFDSNISLPQNSDRVFCVMLEKFSEAINYDDCMIRSFVQGIFKDIAGTLSPLELKTNSNFFEKQISDLLLQSPKYISQNTQSAVSHRISNESLRFTFNDKVSKATLFKSQIITGATILLEDAFKFNCEIVECSANNLTPKQLADQVEKHKRADGQYIYEGAFLSREAIENHIKNRHFVFKLVFRYSTISAKDSIIKFKFY